MEVLEEYNKIIEGYQDLQSRKSYLDTTLTVTEKKMEEVEMEQSLLERSTLAIQAVKPLLTQSSIKDCESLANAAIKAVFGFESKVTYSPENQRFVMDQGEYVTDLANAEGGGLVTVVSFVFSVYLLVKLGKRRFLAFDEQFTQVSDAYLPNFLEFLRALCKDLGADILLISHDERVTIDDVDTLYTIEDGKAIKNK